MSQPTNPGHIAKLCGLGYDIPICLWINDEMYGSTIGLKNDSKQSELWSHLEGLYIICQDMYTVHGTVCRDQI